MLRALVLLLATLIAPLAVAQQSDGRTILVLDMSGSMWGQIDEVAKVTIAQEVIGDLLGEIPAEEQLGLALYGHRVRGDCTDIEIAVEPGLDTRDAIRDAVNGTRPLGKTPMTDSIIAAAEALRYTEDAATVILISDGVETCNPDPCAAARTLEETGVDFTAHVIGFDVEGDPQAVAQMQCIAEETGGQYLSAENADELAEALEQVAVEPAPEPVDQTIQLVGVLTPGGAEIPERIDWTVFEGSNAIADGSGPGESFLFGAGEYRVQGIRISDAVEVSQTFQVAMDITDGGGRIEVVFPEPAEPTEITFVAKIDSEDGEVITDPIFWEIVDDANANLGPDAPSPSLTLEMDEGSYTVTAYWTVAEVTSEPRQFIVGADPREIIIVFEEPLPSATVTAPTSAPMGSTIEVAWTGPDETRDYIGIGTVEAENSQQWDNFARVNTGNPVELILPPRVGPHVIRYFRNEGREALTEVTIELTPVETSLTAPTEAVVGSTIEVAWTGPDYTRDYIGIGKVGAEGSAQWENFVRTNTGTPVELVIPTEPGDYIITYFIEQDRVAMAQVPITVVATSATLTAPSEAVVGSTIDVGWTGPDYPRDYIGIGKVGAEGSAQWENYVRTNTGTPVELVIPTEPGDYIIQYFVEQDRLSIAQVAITVTETQATLTAPSEATAGSTIEIGWTGPDYPRDYIGIGKVDAQGSAQWENYTRTSEGSPLDLLVPTEPGSYMIRYFVEQDRVIIAEAAITVTAATATVSAPTEAVAGSTIEVGWTGPDYPRDYIGIGLVGAEGSARWAQYTRTNEGSPLELVTPIAPGDYVIQYFVEQDRLKLAEATIRLTAPQASLTAPAEVAAGSEFEIGWTGPDYARDYIALAPATAEGSDRWRLYERTARGNPVTMTAPSEAGDYVIRYFADQDRTVLAELAIKVVDVPLDLNFPATVPGGTTIPVQWTGPDAGGDNIQIGPVGERSYLYYQYTSEGPVVNLIAPIEPGTYEIRYVFQDREIILTKEIIVTDPGLSLTVPETVVGGSTMEIGWTGPNAPGDNIQVGPVGEGTYIQYAYTTDGNPVSLFAPIEAGTYEIRYKFRDRETALTQTFTVTAPDLGLTAPASVVAGSEFEVGWTGPNVQGDNVQIGPVGESGYITYQYTSRGNPVVMRAPDEPGTYELRYKFRDREIAYTQTIEVTAN